PSRRYTESIAQEGRLVAAKYCRCHKSSLYSCWRLLFVFCRELCSTGLRGEFSAQKVPNCGCDFLAMGFQREVPGVIELHFGARDVALKRLCAFGEKERIVLAPHRE